MIYAFWSPNSEGGRRDLNHVASTKKDLTLIWGVIILFLMSPEIFKPLMRLDFYGGRMIKSGISFLKTLTDGSPLYKFASFLVFAICFCAIAALYFGTLHPTAPYLVFVLFMACVVSLLCLAKLVFKELREEKRDIQTMAISPLPMPPSRPEVGQQVVKVRSTRTPKSKPVRAIESEK